MRRGPPDDEGLSHPLLSVSKPTRKVMAPC